MRYNNYHKHSHYSNLRTLDCVTKPIDYILRAKELGHTNYFTTEHGWQGNIHEAFTLCQEHGLKCIYGVEAYYVDDCMDKTARENSHVILIALTENSRRQINTIISKANTDGYYYKPRIDFEMIMSLNPTETIVTTACVAGRMFKEGYVEKFLLPVKNHFKDNFYLEIQAHKDDYQIEYNKKLLAVSKEYGIKMIHANDSHYIKSDGAKYRDLFLKAKGIIYEEEGGFILDYPTYEEIVERYKQQNIFTDDEIKEIINNTLILDKSDGIKIDKDFKIPKITEGDSNEVLKDILYTSWDKKKKNIKKEKIEEYEIGIEYEYNMIKDCGMADYFILDNKIVDRAVNVYNAVLTKSGRGSAVSYYNTNLLGLTEVDRFKAPITLYPSRFMTTERILESKSLPDIDLNFADVEPVIKASKDILGEDGIYYMIAYKPLQDSSAFRLWCKANDMQLSDYNDVAKNIEDYTDDKYWGKIIKDSKVFVGVIESVSPSPCSFLLSDKPISEEIGLIKVGDQICCCLDGYNCDAYKYLKNDYLTVQVYSLIAKTYELIGRPIDDISTLVNNCKDNVWDIYKFGITTTINQADSDFGKQILKKYCPKNLAELSAFVAAIRPGFASLLNNFVERKEYSTGVKELDGILEDSFNYLMYQESIMKYLVWLGIEEKNTYDIIKKIAKKKFPEKELAELKSELLSGWIKQVGKEDGFNDTWQVVEDAVKYSFNASHSLSVAIDSLYGAYLKANYPIEYMTTAFNQYADDAIRTENLIEELSYFNILIESPQFRYSKGEYFFNKETNTIYKGVGSIKYLNLSVSDEIYSLKDNNYETFIDLVYDIKEKTSCNSKQLDLLIKINYFKEFGSIKKLLKIIDVYNKFNGKKTLSKEKLDILGLSLNQALLYGEETAKQIKNVDSKRLIKDCISDIRNDEFSIVEVIKFQKEILGYIDYINPKLDKKYAMVYTLDDKYSTKKTVLYCLNNGKTAEVRVSNKVFSNKPFKEGNVVYTTSLNKDFKAVKTGEDAKGKPIWGKDLNVVVWWLQDYNIVNEL